MMLALGVFYYLGRAQALDRRLSRPLLGPEELEDPLRRHRVEPSGGLVALMTT
jgi:hypothetical protein